MPAFPYYPRYPQRFALSTATWTDEEVGAYTRLLDYQWDHGSIPADPKRRNRIADSLPGTWAVIAEKFKPGEDGELRNPFLEKIRAETEAKSEKARRSAETRWERERTIETNANAMRTHSERTADAMHDPSNANGMHPRSEILDPKSKNRNPKSKKKPPRSDRWSVEAYEVPDHMAPIRDKLQEWLDYRKRTRCKPYSASLWITRAWNDCGESCEGVRDGIDYAMAREYIGICAPNGKPKQSGIRNPQGYKPGGSAEQSEQIRRLEEKQR